MTNPLPKGDWDGGQTYSRRRCRTSSSIARRARRGDHARVGPGRFRHARRDDAVVLQGPPVRRLQGLRSEQANALGQPEILGSHQRFEQADGGGLFHRSLHPRGCDRTARPGSGIQARQSVHEGPQPSRLGQGWAWLLKRLYEINKRHGKQTMAFEGVGRGARPA